MIHKKRIVKEKKEEEKTGWNEKERNKQKKE